MDFLLLEKLQGFINIFQAVDTHAALSGLWLWGAEDKERRSMLKLLNLRGHNTQRGKGQQELKKKKTSKSRRRSRNEAHDFSFLLTCGGSYWGPGSGLGQKRVVSVWYWPAVLLRALPEGGLACGHHAGQCTSHQCDRSLGLSESLPIWWRSSSALLHAHLQRTQQRERGGWSQITPRLHSADWDATGLNIITAREIHLQGINFLLNKRQCSVQLWSLLRADRWQ